MIARTIIAVAIVLFALVTYPGALLTSLATRLTSPPPASPAPRGALPWLHVEHPAGGRPYIADDQGRMVILHGQTPASLLEFGPGTTPPYPVDPLAYAQGACPPNDPQHSRYPPLCEADLKAMAALGSNLIRLPISWSRLEPERGHINSLLLDRIRQIVDWARAAGMYVIIDMHQNAYSHYVGASDRTVNLAYDSGAPPWATFTDGLPSTLLVKDQREVNPAVFEATTNFWYDRSGIQDEYIAAVAAVVKRFKDDSVVAGFGLYNEPWFGWNLPPGFDDLLLFPFYRRAIDAITGVHDGLPCWSGFFMPAVCGYRDLGVDDRRHLLFLDTGLQREITDFPTHFGMPVSSYPNLVLGLHPYTHIYTLDQFVSPLRDSYPWGGYDQGWDFAEHEAKSMDMALFMEEFGNNPEDDGRILVSQLREAEKHRVGWAFWTWKENGGGGAWGVFDPSQTASGGCIRAGREWVLASAYPRVTADAAATYSFDPSGGGFSFHATGHPGDPSTVVFVPGEVTGQISSDGAVQIVVSEEDDGSRLVFGTPSGGAFTIAVAAEPRRLRSCS